MIKIRGSHERGKTEISWLKSRHSFSFGDYYDLHNMGFKSLRVINEDYIDPTQGFHTHSHRDMEIITYVIEGELEHKDSLGNGSIIRPGDVQRMTAGTGISHSEFNPSPFLTHLLQIWIIPQEKGLIPSYEQKLFSTEEKQNQLRLLASQDGREGSVTIHQNVSLYDCLLSQDHTIEYDITEGRSIWIQMIQGQVKVNDHLVIAGDGISLDQESLLTIQGMTPSSEFLVFDLI